jgi:hypothetical protein
MAGQVLFIADRSEAVIQPGQPSSQMAAWILDIPDGGSALVTAADFAAGAGFPIGTRARVIDLTDSAAVLSVAMSLWQLDAQWVSVSG